jgi:adenylate cyclase
MDRIDFEAEGLLEGLDESARKARLRLLCELADAGVPLEDLRHAVSENRLALLPVERVLGGEDRYTAAEVAERSGLEPEFLRRQWRAQGLAVPAEGAAAFTDRDLEAARRVAALRAGGLPEEGILEVSRVLGMTMSQLAAATRGLVAEAFVRPGGDEHEIAERLRQAGEVFAPMMGEALSYLFDVHLREQIRHDAVAAPQDGAAGPDGGQQATVAFADLVGFTGLGEMLEPEELGAVTGRLAELAADVVEPPVRLVKLLGDAAMLVGQEAASVLEAAIALVEAAEREGEDYPLLRAGVAAGWAIPRGGDWYGRPVNLASRITSIARPGSVLTDENVHEALADDYSWSFAGSKKLKGVGEVRLFRCRRAPVAEA